MSDAYVKHVEKRIKEMHERMSKSKLHSTKKHKYWITILWKGGGFGGWKRNAIQENAWW